MKRLSTGKFLFASMPTMVLWFSAILGGDCFAQATSYHNDTLVDSIRPVTVADMIEMTEPGTIGFGDNVPLAQFCPDGKQFVVIVRKGNVLNNTNEYSLLLWKTGQLVTSHSTRPTVLLVMSSSSNRPAIQQLTWLRDNETVAFLGEHPNEAQQLYLLNSRTRVLTKLTKHNASVHSYSITPDGKTFVFTAEEPLTTIFDDKAKHEGVLVSSQYISALIRNEKGGRYFGNYQYYLQTRSERAVPLRAPDKISSLAYSVALSPNGKYVALRCLVRVVPEIWKEYSDPEMKSLTNKIVAPGQYSFLSKYILFDIATRRFDSILNSPLSGNNDSTIAWSPDSRSVVITDTYLPLEATTSDERTTRQSTAFAVQVNLRTGKLTKVGSDELQIIRWEPESNHLIVRAGKRWSLTNRSVLTFWQNHGKWEAMPEAAPSGTSLRIVLEQDMNSPPKIYAIETSKGQKLLLFDLNPKFKELNIAKVEEVHWKGSDGHEIKGGLYYPVHYTKGKRYPLVIQNHGFDPNEFAMGPGHSAFAAQPLAGNDIFVLQIAYSTDGHDVPNEARIEAAAYEGAIDYLDERGLIDRKDVGIGGFSRTGLHVKYALTHSAYHFVAATVTDDTDGGYFQYLVNMNSYVGFAQDFEQLNGGMPFGSGLPSWGQRSPAFNIDKVETPVRILALSPETVLYEWEWFAGLYRLGKPVEMIYIPDGQHELQKPWDRMIAQQGNVDWFVFWLKGQESNHSLSASEYVRWQKMRAEVKGTVATLQ